MASAATQIIYVKAEDKPAREGTLHYVRFSSGDRVVRAAGMLLGCWAAAAVTLFIPIAHFVLVPGFLIAGPVFAYLRYRVERESKQVMAQCPVCDQAVTIDLDAGDQPPLYVYCPKCHNSVRVVEK